MVSYPPGKGKSIPARGKASRVRVPTRACANIMLGVVDPRLSGRGIYSPSAQMMTAAEVRHHRGQARPDDMGADPRGDRAPIEVATAGAGALVSLVFGDDGRQFGEFGHLMPGGLGVAGGGFGRQGSLAWGAGRGPVRHDGVDPLGWEAMAMMSRMPRLPAWRASGRCLDHRFGGPGWIDRRRRGGVGGIAVQLTAQVVEFGL